MRIQSKKPRKSINKAFLKAGAAQGEINLLKKNLSELFNIIDEEESEEHVKNDIKDFLSNTFYQDYYINTIGRTDLAIHLSKSNKSKAGVLMECKRPLNKSEMISRENINAKAMHEVMLYYLRQRVEEGNNDIRHIIITNIYEWFVYDASEFEKHFYKNNKLVREYKKWKSNQKVSSNTDLFYQEIASDFLDKTDETIECSYFDLRDYKKLLERDDKDKELIPLLKILSPEHLLKLPFANDSNRLEKSFYYELLHIIGLEEHKEKSKKVIRRPLEKRRNAGSLLENTINNLKTTERLRHLKNVDKYGETKDEQLFNVSLELNITWINRVLFLKLLEAQLLKYHKGDESFKFLNTKTIADFDELNELFFEVLARQDHQREEFLREKFKRVPYLNSSLFEINSLEDATIVVSNLKDRYDLPLYDRTVLKNEKGKRLQGELPFLEYLFIFLDAYDFSSEGLEEIRRENKSLINASVLGLIFEKINGYKEGSYFTPGFITMYMCRETIRRAVVQKFNDALGEKYKDFGELKKEIDRTAEGRKKANVIINSLKICDPAVGSGHFLVSALNEIIAIKSELGVLNYPDGSRVQFYNIEIENDELIITDEETHEIFEYTVNPLPDGKGWKAPAEKQRLQECLFYEKQTIIENCLFGVDINPNSVKICRLRLWIELLKNAYYKDMKLAKTTSGNSEQNGPPFGEIKGGGGLETLPNIDINIKQGNSLISRFPLDASISKMLSKSKWNITDYRLAVDTYRNATTKEEKREMLQLIDSIKNDFRTEISRNDPKQKRLDKLGSELYEKYQANKLIDVELTEKQKAREKKERRKLEEKINKLSTEIKDIKENKIYLDAFEWRFEFPEVLDDDGNFTGFDVVIGNPPYINFRDIKDKNEKFYLSNQYSIAEYQSDFFILFIQLSYNLIKDIGNFAFIMPNSITNNLNNSKARKFILDRSCINSIVNTPIGVFPDATVDTIVLTTELPKKNNSSIKSYDIVDEGFFFIGAVKQEIYENNNNFYFDFLIGETTRNLLSKIEQSTKSLHEITDSSSGIKEYEAGKGTPPQTKEDRINKVFNSNVKVSDDYLKHLTGKEIEPYIIKWNYSYLKYGPWLAAPRNPKYFKGERVIIREILRKDKLIAAYTEENYTVKNTAHIFIPKKNINARFLVGLLNSRLFGFYFANKFSERDQVFPKAKIGQCRQLPIQNINNSNKKIAELISTKVTQILTLKRQDPEAHTSALEAEIDRMVYELYGLTEEEVRVVEETIE